MEDRRAKGLCFNCDEKLSSIHVCKNRRQLLSIELEHSELEEQGEECLLEYMKIFAMTAHDLATDVEGSIMPHVSIHAMYGTYDFRTMKVNVAIKGKYIQVLTDTGCTQMFLNHNTTMR